MIALFTSKATETKGEELDPSAGLAVVVLVLQLTNSVTCSNSQSICLVFLLCPMSEQN